MSESVVAEPLDTCTVEFGGVGYYICEFCRTVSPKNTWGPGWVTCPTCGKQARSVSEREAAR